MTVENLKLVVFDWDGTLMDSEARIVDCMRSALQETEWEPQPDSAIRDIIGLGLTEAIQALLPAATEDQVTRLSERYRWHWLESGRRPSPLFAGAEETLRQLANQDYLLAVATGKSRRGLDRSLDETGLRKMFQATRCADEAFSKPHPQMLLEIMDSLGIGPSETLMIGDTEYDMEMAANAGTHALAVSFGVHASERLLRHKVLHCVDSLPEIPLWLQSAGVPMASEIL